MNKRNRKIQRGPGLHIALLKVSLTVTPLLEFFDQINFLIDAKISEPEFVQGVAPNNTYSNN